MNFNWNLINNINMNKIVIFLANGPCLGKREGPGKGPYSWMTYSEVHLIQINFQTKTLYIYTEIFNNLAGIGKSQIYRFRCYP